jgi:hypothetical protein
MSNMSYCRFQNTANDLRDCVQNLRTLDPENHGTNVELERNARAELIRMAAEIIANLGIEDAFDDREVESAITRLDKGEGYKAEEDF